MSQQAYVQALALLFTHVPEVKGWLLPDEQQPQNFVVFQNEVGHKFLIARNASVNPTCHSTFEPAAVGMGAVQPPKHNGKIRSHFPFNLRTIRERIVPLMRDLAVPLPETKRGASGKASGPRLSAQEVLAMLASEGDSPAPVAPTAVPLAPAPPADDDEFSEDALEIG